MGGLPIRVDVIEGHVVITAATAGTLLRKGDVLLSVDGVDAMEYMEKHSIARTMQCAGIALSSVVPIPPFSTKEAYACRALG
jgi:hypothetical protein